MDNLILAINTVLPFLLYISFGYLIRTVGIADEPFMNKLNRLVFLAFFPFNMFINVYEIPQDLVIEPKLMSTAVISILVSIALLMLFVPMLVKENARRGVIIQAIYRGNFVLFAIPIAEHLFGADGKALAAMMIAVVIPVYNCTAVVILEIFRGSSIDPLHLIKGVITNPLILGAVAGGIFHVLRIPLANPLYDFASSYADATTPIALFALGGTLHFSAVGHNLKYLVPSLTIRMVLIPIAMLVTATLLGFSPLERFLLFIMYATPISTSSFTMAKSMGGDGELAGQFVVFSTALSIITLFFWVLVLKALAMI